jgi:hypothetical protein
MAAMPGNADDELRDLQRREEEAVATASRLAESFAGAAGRFAAEWIAKHVNGEVTRAHAHTLSLGSKRLKQLKADLKVLVEATPARTRESLEALPWSYRNPGETVNDASYPQYAYSPLRPRDTGNPPEPIAGPLRLILGEAGRLLDSYGYPKADNWKQHGGYRYPYMLELSAEAKASLRDAADADATVIKLRGEVKHLQRRIGEERARAAWDEA